jgi:hypothetical protein
MPSCKCPDFWSVISLLTSIPDWWDQQVQNTADYGIGKRFNLYAGHRVKLVIGTENAS